MDLISVIVPVYNSEDFLVECLNSIMNQTYENLDIVLIDDGSTDCSGDICDEYAKTDQRIRVIHKRNEGISIARNVGLQNAKGSYISFVDSDDKIQPDMIEYLYKLVKKYQCRMSLCSHIVIWKYGRKGMGNGSEEKCSSEKCLKRMLYHDVIDTSVWGKLYSSDLFKDIRFPEGKLFEDIGTVYKTFLNSEEIACGYENKYEYWIRNNSITTKSFSKSKLDLLSMTDNMAKDVCQKFPNLKTAVLRRRIYARFSTLNQMLDVCGYEKEKEQIIRFIMNNGKVILKDPLTPVRDKSAVLLLLFGGYQIYRLCWKLVKNQKFAKN